MSAEIHDRSYLSWLNTNPDDKITHEEARARVDPARISLESYKQQQAEKGVDPELAGRVWELAKNGGAKPISVTPRMPGAQQDRRTSIAGFDLTSGRLEEAGRSGTASHVSIVLTDANGKALQLWIKNVPCCGFEEGMEDIGLDDVSVSIGEYKRGDKPGDNEYVSKQEVALENDDVRPFAIALHSIIRSAREKGWDPPDEAVTTLKIFNYMLFGREQ